MKRIISFLLLINCTYSLQAQVPAPANTTGASDTHKNWVVSRTFDENGNIIGESKQFFDDNGRNIQAQSKIRYRKDATTVYTHVFARQTIRDAFGREAAQTLQAPINSSEFMFDPAFVRTSTGSTYDYRNFDRFNPSGIETDKTLNPDAVGAASTGTLGWYYSNNNTWEPYTPTTDYPYIRESYYRDGTGNVKMNAGVGEVYRSGSGHELRSFVAPVVNELDHYTAIRNKYFVSAGELPVSLKSKAIQEISRDVNGNEVISIHDKDGNLLMTAYPGTELVTTNTVTLNPGYVYNINDNLSAGSYFQYLRIKGNTIRIYETQNNGTSYTLIYDGLASGYSSPVNLPWKYKIESSQPFSVSYDGYDPLGIHWTIANDAVAEMAGTAQYYFKLSAPANVTIAGSASFSLYDMGTEQTVSFISGSSLAAGYYRLVNNSEIPITLTYGNSYKDVSYYFYDQMGQLMATLPPQGVKSYNSSTTYTKYTLPFITLFEYDVQGRQISVQMPEEGKSEFIYRKDGAIRFSQNAEQRTGNRYSYTNYDALGRPIESGEMQSDAGIVFNSDLTATVNPMRDILENVSASGGLTVGTKKDVVTILYDIADNTYNGVSGYTQDAYNLKGAVSASVKYSSVTGAPPYSGVTMVSASYYNYDEEGKVLWVVRNINGLGKKTFDFTYNVLGQLTKKIYQKNTAAETFVHYYEYDPANLQLWKVYTNTVDNPATKILQANHIYYLHGPLKRVELATDLQGIDYTYTLQGTLKAINNNDKTKDPGGDGTTFKTDAFGMVLDYYPNDYVNSRTTGIQPIKGVNTSTLVSVENYAGNIKAMSWFSKKPASVLVGNPNAENPTTYVYNYDDKYQLTESTWGTTLNFANTPATFTSTSFNKERIKHPTTGVSGYDANGNIQFLQRYNTAGSITDKFTYNYQVNTNKLTSIIHDNNGTNQTYASYTYDALGQLTYENTLNAANKKYIKYDVTGKVLVVARDAAFTQKVVEYVYDETGNRIIKRNYNASYQHIQNTYYVADVIYTQPVSGGTPGAITVQEYEIDGGSDRVGVYYRPTNIYAYQLCDHLGNVRAVVARNAGNLEIRMYSDYYPYGMVIQQGGSNDYRYGYQGNYSEKDKETDWNAFELRMYDSRIGRWLTPDPENEYFSPYVNVGNDPVSGTDPTGGCKDCPSKAKEGQYHYENGIAYQASIINGESVWAQVQSQVFVTPNYYQINRDLFTQRFQNGEDLIQPGDRASYLANVELWTRVATAEQEYWNFQAKLASFIGTSLVPVGRIAKWGVQGYKAWRAARLAKGGNSLVQANRKAGNLFRDELAAALRAEGRVVETEVYKRTPFGKRFIDIDVWHNGVNLGGIEAKVGGSRYFSLQKLKDAWLGANGYPVQLVRKPSNW